MSDASFASLNPALLARKGGAKPAMRPQLTNLPDAGTPTNLEDLGWNDMGQDDEPDGSDGKVIHLTPAQANDSDAEEADQTPAIVRQQDELAERIKKKPAKKKARAKSAKASSAAKGRRAA